MITPNSRLALALLICAGCSRAPETPAPPEFSEPRRVVLTGFQDWVADPLHVDHDGELQDDGSYLVRTGKWRTPPFDTESQAWYRAVYETRSAHLSYATARFYDRNGTELNADDYTGVDPTSDWVGNTLFFTGRPFSGTATFGVEANSSQLAVRNVTVEAVSPQHVLAWMDDLYSHLPPVSFTPPANRWDQLPQTRRKLREGGTLRILFLGDSIANDFANSHFHLLLQRANPDLTVHLTPSIRGSTGCRYYRYENRVQDYVIRHRPDLVIVLNLGVGHGPSVLDVISQVRASIDCEFLVMSGAVSLPIMGLRHYPRDVWRRKLEEHVVERAQTIDSAKHFCGYMQSHAAEHRFAVFDLRGAWEEYLASCDKPNEYFLRDAIHANERGKQILARIAEILFSDGDA